MVVGPPGAGKTTVGTLLADRLGVAFRDTDADIVRTTGEEIADLFVSYGEEHFRGLERAAVATALTEHDGVLALGGGAVLDAGTRAALAAHPVVFLDVGLAAAARRVGLARDRPVLAINPRAQLHRLLEQRRPFYEEVATVTVETDAATPGEVVDRVLALVETR